MLVFLILLIIFQIELTFSSFCKEGENNCSKCNPLTKLCIKCKSDIYVPNLNGGCEYTRKCEFGKNHCIECSEERSFCKKCENDYFPDENGGCSYTDNCEVSENGSCIKCKSNYILIGIEDYYIGGIKVCKSLNTEDLNNCESINMDNGVCFFCKKGFFLNNGDKKCTNVENCYESSYNICKRCNKGYYLDKKNNKCIIQKNMFAYCKESIDGEKCSLCDNGYYLAEDGNCINMNYCQKVDKISNKCKKCINGYFLTEDGYACTSEKNCSKGDNNFGICNKCKDNYYLDNKDRKCKSNQEENDLKYCENSYGNICNKCIIGYSIGEDHKCSTSYDCKKSINTTCIECIDNYHLSLNNICTNVERCIYASFYVLGCVECEENYYYDEYNMKCKLAKGNFINCKSSEDLNFCQKCKNNSYLNLTDNLCYSNEDKYYKCAKVNRTEDDPDIEKCLYCIDDYYLGRIDNKCSRIDGCDISENENKCIKCDEYSYCLNMKTNKCIPNDEIISEDKKYYFRCNRTNIDGTACEICLEDFVLDENGLCVDEIHCIEKKDGICQRCQNDENGYFCLNKYFGCEEIYDEGCLECNNIFDLFSCTKCLEGYEFDQNNKCIEIDLDDDYI